MKNEILIRLNNDLLYINGVLIYGGEKAKDIFDNIRKTLIERTNLIQGYHLKMKSKEWEQHTFYIKEEECKSRE